ncbi:MAG TPA: hypothetical protein VF546_09735 [Pyrinomonadaceae bacterium]|jgi:photosystem II stability/assembly factor-like uncharacterized protein
MTFVLNSLPKSALCCSALLLLFCHAVGAQWLRQASGTTVRLRGVSAVSASVAWASGDKGTFARTTDGGRTWVAGTVPGAGELDFRDVDAFDADTAYLLAIGAGERSRIYKTTDGGRSWVMQFKNSKAAAFFDCMAYWDRDHGIAISDPVEGRFLVLTTSDGGKSWVESPAAGMPAALPGEGAFAASGTCVAVQGQTRAWFGTGGPAGARVFRSADRGRTWQVARTALTSGKSAGIFSLTFWDVRHGVAVGGDYTKEREIGSNVAWTSDGGRTWREAVAARPNGYRSCVAYVPGTRAPTLVAVGPSGSDYSSSGGRSWQVLAADGGHSASFTAAGGTGWAVGEGGLILKYAPP